MITKSDYEVTFAQSKHIDGIYSVVNEAYKKEKTRLDGVPRLSGREEVKNILEDTQRNAWMVLLDPDQQDKVIGTLNIRKSNGVYSLHALAIDKSYQGQQLGPLMLRHAEQYIKDKGATKAYLEVVSVAKSRIPSTPTNGAFYTKEQFDAEEDKLAEFYVKNGYRFTGTNLVFSEQWHQALRKTEYFSRVFFREMEKDLTP